MIAFEKHTLANGLTVIAHQDTTTPMVAVNTLYDVGARDEHPDKTGFAHLFEHLMFGGSVNIPNFDKPLQAAGGESNAFTSNDITNYYDTLPSVNVETALWLESDRMLSLAFTDKSLEVQRSVVIEEFKQRYLNQPYGDVWHLLRELVYQVHAYQWPTIGKEIAHIEDATMADVRAFFNKHYSPVNAILCVAGGISPDRAFQLCEHWYGEIPSGEKYVRSLPAEPPQTEFRVLEVEREVPQDALYMAFRMCSRTHEDYPVVDLLSDLLGRGSSSRLVDLLVKQKRLFSQISAYVMGSFDEGLFIISGKLNADVDFSVAEEAIWEILEDLKQNLVPGGEMKKLVNKYESAKLFGDTNVLNRAMNLCYFELLGDIHLVDLEMEKYRSVDAEKIQGIAQNMLVKTGCSVLRYKSK